MTQKTKQIIVALVIIVVAFIGFKMFFPSDGAGDEALVASNPESSEFVDGQAILALLNKLNEIKIDDSIFEDPIFNALYSFEKPIEDQAIGRNNPFMPIGVDGTGLTLPRSTSTNPFR